MKMVIRLWFFVIFFVSVQGMISLEIIAQNRSQGARKFMQLTECCKAKKPDEEHAFRKKLQNIGTECNKKLGIIIYCYLQFICLKSLVTS